MQYLCFAVFPKAVFLDHYCPTSEISSLAPCSIAHHFKTLRYCVSTSSGEPSHLVSMLSLAPKPRDMRSSGFHLLSVPRVKIHAGTLAFLICCPYSLEFTLNMLNHQLA